MDGVVNQKIVIEMFKVCKVLNMPSHLWVQTIHFWLRPGAAEPLHFQWRRPRDAQVGHDVMKKHSGYHPMCEARCHQP